MYSAMKNPFANRRSRTTRTWRRRSGDRSRRARADAHVLKQRRRCRRRGLQHFVRADARQQHRGDEVRQRVDHHRHRRGQPLNQHAGEAGAADLGDGVGDLQLRVAFEQKVAPDQHRQIRVVGQAEQRGEPSYQRGDHVQLHDAEMRRPRGDRNAQYQQRANDVGPHEDRPFRMAVDESACKQSDDHAGNHRQHAQGRDLHGIIGNEQDRNHRQRGARDATAERADGLCAPQVHEVAMPRERP
jgi:hypothetical protein